MAKPKSKARPAAGNPNTQGKVKIVAVDTHETQRQES